MGGQNRPFCKRNRFYQFMDQASGQKDGAEHGTLAVAEFQSAGRGRLTEDGKRPEGSSIMMTLLFTSGIFTAVCVYADTGYGNGSGTGSRGTGV